MKTYRRAMAITSTAGFVFRNRRYSKLIAPSYGTGVYSDGTASIDWDVRGDAPGASYALAISAFFPIGIKLDEYPDGTVTADFIGFWT